MESPASQVTSLGFLLKQAFDFGWLFALLSVVTEVMRDAANPGDTGGFLSWSTVAASGGAGRVARLRHGDIAGQLVHATGLLQDAVVHLAGGAEDHALGFRQAHTIGGPPGEVCRHGRVASGRVLE